MCFGKWKIQFVLLDCLKYCEPTPALGFNFDLLITIKNASKWGIFQVLSLLTLCSAQSGSFPDRCAAVAGVGWWHLQLQNTLTPPNEPIPSVLHNKGDKTVCLSLPNSSLSKWFGLENACQSRCPSHFSLETTRMLMCATEQNSSGF